MLFVASLFPAKVIAAENDSIQIPERISTTIKFFNSNIGQASIVSLPLIAGGLIVKSEDDHFRAFRNDYIPKFDHWYDDALQYAPAVTLLTMKLSGVKSKSNWPQMLTADGFSVALTAGIVELLKTTTNVRRPDGSDNHSFPSGHTATAFMTATMLHHEYGEKYPWLSVMGYGCATATGLMRMANNRHWLSDVMAGAGIGILTTEVGYLLSDLIFHRPILQDNDYFNDGYQAKYTPSFIGLYVSFNVPLSRYDIVENLEFKTSSGSTFGIEGAWFPCKNFGIGGRTSFSNMQFYANDETNHTEHLKYFSLLAGGYFSIPISSRFLLGAKITSGLNHYYPLDFGIASGEKLSIEKSTGFAFGTGISATFRISAALSYKLFCDYDILPPHSSYSHEYNHSLGIGGQIALTFN